jgi:hypothetical protein
MSITMEDVLIGLSLLREANPSPRDVLELHAEAVAACFQTEVTVTTQRRPDWTAVTAFCEANGAWSRKEQEAIKEVFMQLAWSTEVTVPPQNVEALKEVAHRQEVSAEAA